MRNIVMTLGLLALTVCGQADTGFVGALPAEDFGAAGLQKLSPGELAKLEALVERYKTGVVAAAPQLAQVAAIVSQHETEQNNVSTETKSKITALKAKEENSEETASANKQPSWFTALITLSRSADKPGKAEPLESRLLGDFNGWSGHTTFTLENHTRWMQQNHTEAYVFSPTLHSPRVKIRPASTNGYWLEVDGVNLQVRVVPLALPDQK